MQVFKTYHVKLVLICLLACSCLSASMPLMADDSTQITALQNKVNALEQELILIKTMLNQNSSNEDIDTHQDREIMLSARDKLTLKAGKSSIELTKNGRITMNGSVFNVKSTQDSEMRGSKIKDN